MATETVKRVGRKTARKHRVPCRQCGRIIVRYESQLTGKNTFCSHQHQAMFYSLPWKAKRYDQKGFGITAPEEIVVWLKDERSLGRTQP